MCLASVHTVARQILVLILLLRRQTNSHGDLCVRNTVEFDASPTDVSSVHPHRPVAVGRRD
jgi:hypothetical protein